MIDNVQFRSRIGEAFLQTSNDCCRATTNKRRARCTWCCGSVEWFRTFHCRGAVSRDRRRTRWTTSKRNMSPDQPCSIFAGRARTLEDVVGLQHPKGEHAALGVAPPQCHANLRENLDTRQSHHCGCRELLLFFLNSVLRLPRYVTRDFVGDVCCEMLSAVNTFRRRARSTTSKPRSWTREAFLQTSIA